MTGLSALRGCLPATPHERAYALITTVDSMGTGSFLTISVVLFVRLVGVSPTQVGTALGIGGIVSLFARVPLGRLSDRLGHRRTLILVHVVRGLAFPGYLVIHGFAAFLVLSVFILIVDGWESPVRKVVLYAFTPLEDRVRVAAYNRSVYNLAFSIGSLLAALALANPHSRLSLYLVVGGNAISFLLAAALATRIPSNVHAVTIENGVPVRSRKYAVVGLVLGSLFLCTSILTIGLPLLVLQKFHSHQWLIGLAMAVNTVVAVTLQVRLSRGTSDIAGAVRTGLLGGLTLALACVLFFASASANPFAGVVLLLLAVVTLSVGELMASAATWGLSVSLRPHDLTAQNQSVWSMYNSLPQLLGPFIVVWSLHELHDVGWLLMGAIIAIAATALRPVALTVNDNIRRSTAEQQVPAL
ncbi:MAG: MFS transporter [Actinomycetota bacterium]|nr:MFS transporter [Actinomycetota bacterium]